MIRTGIKMGATFGVALLASVTVAAPGFAQSSQSGTKTQSAGSNGMTAPQQTDAAQMNGAGNATGSPQCGTMNGANCTNSFPDKPTTAPHAGGGVGGGSVAPGASGGGSAAGAAGVGAGVSH